MPDSSREVLIRAAEYGKLTAFKHVNNKLYIELAVGYKEESSNYIDALFNNDLLPKDFNFPIYGIRRDNSRLPKNFTELEVSTIHGKLPNQVIGKGGKYYNIHNLYCFNMYGQGLRIENLVQLGTMEEWFRNKGERELARQKFPRVNFTLSEEHSRVAPLGPEDYGKINKMFEDIDAGIYQYRA